MAKPILSRQPAFPQDPEENCVTIARHNLDSIYEVWYALDSAVHLAREARTSDDSVQDIAVICARDLGRILSEIERRNQEGGRQ